MRLIDADKLKEHIKLIIACWNCSPVLSPDEAQKSIRNLQVALHEIDETPTAYDVDKVSEQIEKIMDDESIRFVQQSVNRAVKIVKSGGAE